MLTTKLDCIERRFRHTVHKIKTGIDLGDCFTETDKLNFYICAKSIATMHRDIAKNAELIFLGKGDRAYHCVILSTRSKVMRDLFIKNLSQYTSLFRKYRIQNSSGRSEITHHVIKKYNCAEYQENTMLSIQQFLLAKLSEEASELSVRAVKAQHFGIDEIQPGQPQTNLARIVEEVNDVMSIVHLISMLNPEIVGYVPEADKIKLLAKAEKMLHYLTVSERHETVEGEVRSFLETVIENADTQESL